MACDKAHHTALIELQQGAEEEEEQQQEGEGCDSRTCVWGVGGAGEGRGVWSVGRGERRRVRRIRL